MWRGCGLIIMMSDVRPRSRRRGFRPFRCRVTMPVKCSQLKPVHTSNNVEATLSNATSRTILSTTSNVATTLLPLLTTMLPFRQHFGNNVAGFGNNIERNFVLSTKRKQILHVQFVSTLSKGRNFTINSFDRHCCRFWQRSRMLLRQSRTLLRHCCWCGRGFLLAITVSDDLFYVPHTHLLHIVPFLSTKLTHVPLREMCRLTLTPRGSATVC